jgi:hypothetical protein
MCVSAADRTQGPACALACPAATLFRNYFVNGVGQCAAGMQLNLLMDVAAELDNAKHGYWRVVNGYCLEGDAEDAVARLRQRLSADADDVAVVAADAVRAFARIARASKLARRVMDALRVGVHWNTSVSGRRHTVAQVLCAAVPVSYSRVDAAEWQPFATTVLNAAYEATLSAAALLAVKKKQRQVWAPCARFCVCVGFVWLSVAFTVCADSVSDGAGRRRLWQQPRVDPRRHGARGRHVPELPAGRAPCALWPRRGRVSCVRLRVSGTIRLLGCSILCT